MGITPWLLVQRHAVVKKMKHFVCSCYGERRKHGVRALEGGGRGEGRRSAPGCREKQLLMSHHLRDALRAQQQQLNAGARLARCSLVHASPAGKSHSLLRSDKRSDQDQVSGIM